MARLKRYRVAFGGRDGRIRYQRMSKSGLSRAYNLAIASTTGSIIVFTDDDCLVPSVLDREDRDGLPRARDGALMYGQVLPAYPENGGEGLTTAPAHRQARTTGPRQRFSCVSDGREFAARRSLFERVGTFDEVLGVAARLNPLRTSTWLFAPIVAMLQYYCGPK